MPAYKDNRQGTWYASFYFENWQGVKQKKLKRGFATKKDALAWEREFLLQQAADLTMTFEAFCMKILEISNILKMLLLFQRWNLNRDVMHRQNCYRISKKNGSAR